MNKALPKSTPVFDTFWKFATERQNIFFRRVSDPTMLSWTDDPILQSHKFTNAYRATDRVSQYLIKHVIYEGEQSPEEVFFRTILFKLFNKIETWEALKSQISSVSWREYSFDEFDRILSNILRQGGRIYSAAYIMASGKSAFGFDRKHQNHLRLLEKMMDERLPQRIRQLESMAAVFELLRSQPTIGDFLGYQYAIDLNYSELTNFSENDFVVPGPGAIRGIQKCFPDLGDLTPSDIIRVTTENQDRELERRGLDFKDLWGRQLHLIDVQNLFCEVDKYARVFHPEVQSQDGRSRIKQKFSANGSAISYWFPPKWGINPACDAVTADYSGRLL